MIKYFTATILALTVFYTGFFFFNNKESTTTIIDSTHPVVNVASNMQSIQVKKIKNLNFTDARTVTIFGEVTPELANNVINKLKDLDDGHGDVHLDINSPGGSVLDGAAIISQMEAMHTPVNTVCVKICASMAAMIHQYGKKRFMVDRAILMFHPASGGTGGGQVKNMISMLTMLDKYVDKMDEYVIKRSKIDPVKWNQMIAYELWIDTEDALKLNLADEVVSLSGKLNLVPAKQDNADNVIKTLTDFN